MGGGGGGGGRELKSNEGEILCFYLDLMGSFGWMFRSSRWEGVFEVFGDLFRFDTPLHGRSCC